MHGPGSAGVGSKFPWLQLNLAFKFPATAFRDVASGMAAAVYLSICSRSKFILIFNSFSANKRRALADSDFGWDATETLRATKVTLEEAPLEVIGGRGTFADKIILLSLKKGRKKMVKTVGFSEKEKKRTRTAVFVISLRRLFQ